MPWTYYPDGKLKSRSDDGVPFGAQVALVDNSDAQNTSKTGTWTRTPSTATTRTDVETLTDGSGDTKSTYGYTAYGNNDDAQFTGIDKPDTQDPGKEPYNAYRYTGKRWDAASASYDMGFRDYSPGLNRFLTRDLYNGALADMNLATDPFTANRYAFTAGNPITRVEIDGHYAVEEGRGYTRDPYIMRAYEAEQKAKEKAKSRKGGGGIRRIVAKGLAWSLIRSTRSALDIKTALYEWQAGASYSYTSSMQILKGEEFVEEQLRLAEKREEEEGIRRHSDWYKLGLFTGIPMPGVGGISGAKGVPPRTGAGVTINRMAVNTSISVQRQGRHVLGAREYKGGSYFNSADDAQRVLDDFHSGAADILGVKGNDIVVRTTNVTGFNVNPGAGYPNQATNVFFIKGTSKPSVVPYNPMWTP
ncbi:RHS repeat-associated core domain-containing protein [Actinopolymorpha alba]|uniref:RHS repeat-associated core domain-containing protein n=1 Tax=Actinopolymorpha alba TaxID=533267 RepID=UPI000380F7E3|nr:RHS repeat-associated core domain-containing protein [Actinopolymorpha alba]